MDSKNRNKIILASASPRRSELLSRAGVDFEVLPSSAPEISDASADPSELASANARIKAESVAARNPGRLVLGADTVVFFNSKIYGKPADIADAKAMLSELQGGVHSVFTGVCASFCGEKGVDSVCAAEESRVAFKKLDVQAIDEYVSKVDVLDKAGAYAAQEHGSMIIEKIDGAFDNVMGLPVELSKKILDTLAARLHI